MAAKGPSGKSGGKGARPAGKKVVKKAVAKPAGKPSKRRNGRAGDDTPSASTTDGDVAAIAVDPSAAAPAPAVPLVPAAPPAGVPLAPLVKVVPAGEPLPAALAPTAAAATTAGAGVATAAAATAAPAAEPTAKRATKKVVKRGPPPKEVRASQPRPPRRKLPPRWVERLFAEPNVDGPRVRIGILWFALLAPAIWFATLAEPATAVPIACLFGFVAVIAALQTGQAWRRAGYRPSRPVAALLAAALPAAAVFDYETPGLIVAVSPLIALAAAVAVPRRRRRTSAVAAAGITLRCCIPVGIAAASMVFVAKLGPAPAISFLVLLLGYDIGSFLVGAESSSPSHGIIAGSATTMVFTAPMWFLGVAFDLPPFGGSAAWVFGGMVAVFAPLGQILGSLCLPTASTWVPALRRLDSYFFTAPLWTYAMWSYLAH